MIDRTKYTKKEILEQWNQLDKQLPYKAVTGTLPVQRFRDRDSAMDFFYKHEGRCVVSLHSGSGTEIIACKDNVTKSQTK